LPAVSKAQQRFFGMVRAAQKGEMKNPSSEILDVADDISVKDAKKFAKTKHKGLPEKKKMEEQQKIKEEFSSYKDFMKSVQAAKERKAKKQQTRKVKDAAYVERLRKGIKFYDSKGSGRLVKGKKVYDK
tara:strand:+ start:516 stop:902 length:387 start_codon:yes stop_codon:yes gene_type:complete